MVTVLILPLGDGEHLATATLVTAPRTSSISRCTSSKDSSVEPHGPASAAIAHLQHMPAQALRPLRTTG